MDLTGTIFLVATPIGNMEDITLRALNILKTVDIIYAEDTRVTRKLLGHFQINTILGSFHSHTSENKVDKMLQEVVKGKNVAVVTDAGSPGISDPAYKLVKKAIENGIPLQALPGATAFVPALTISGLPTDKFYFNGFLPQKKGRQKQLRYLAELPCTVVLYESVHRIEKLVHDIYEVMGNRRICVAREITKMHESVYRGWVKDFVEGKIQFPLKGEFVVCISGTAYKSLNLKELQ